MEQKVKEKIDKINNGIIPDGYQATKIGILPADWKVVNLEDKFNRNTRRNNTNNQNVLTISAQDGLINQSDFFNKEIASDNKENYFLLKKGDFAYNKSYSNGYPFGAIKVLKKYELGVVSPLYICFTPNMKNLAPEYYEHYFEAGILNREINAIAQEGARNHGLLNIGINDFFRTYIPEFCPNQQQKIADILSVWAKEISLKESLIEQNKLLKNWYVQNILSGKVRLPGYDKKWGNIVLADILNEHKGKKGNNCEVYSVSVSRGLVNQIEHLGRSYSSEDTSNYNVVKPKDVVYTKSPTGKFPYGIIKQSKVDRDVIVSPLYGVFTPINEYLGLFLDFYFESYENTNRYLKPIIQKGAKNTINVSNNTFLSGSLRLPEDIEEQIAIVNLLYYKDKEIKLLQKELTLLKHQKKGLMQLLLTGIVRVQY